MSKFIIFSFLSFLNILFAQNCNFTFKGTLAGNSITICFYPDKNNGYVSGELYYGDGSMGKMSFNGTALKNNQGGFNQSINEFNSNGIHTGIFKGILKNGVMQGTWYSADYKRNYPYYLSLSNTNNNSNNQNNSKDNNSSFSKLKDSFLNLNSETKNKVYVGVGILGFLILLIGLRKLFKKKKTVTFQEPIPLQNTNNEHINIKFENETLKTNIIKEMPKVQVDIPKNQPETPINIKTEPKDFQTFYSQIPENGIFELELVNNFDTLYKITTYGNEGEYEFIANNRLDIIASNLSLYIDTACNYTHFNPSFFKIETKQKGKIQLVEGKWKILEKSKIEFV